MRRLLFLGLLGATSAPALDICPQYQAIHERDVVPRIRSGVPFKLLSIAVNPTGSFKRIVRIEYDLWNETVTIDALGHQSEVSPIASAGKKICAALSFPDAPSGEKFEYRLLLNPVLGEGLKRLQENGQSGSGLLRINWGRLVRDLETEKVLIEKESLQ
jgi:hypothetical protein